MPATKVIVLNYSCAMTLKEILGLPDICRIDSTLPIKAQ